MTYEDLNMTRSIATFTLAAALLGCTSELDDDTRVCDGAKCDSEALTLNSKVTSVGDYDPTQVVLLKFDGKSFYPACVGGLIADPTSLQPPSTPRVVTAAHCADWFLSQGGAVGLLTAQKQDSLGIDAGNVLFISRIALPQARNRSFGRHGIKGVAFQALEPEHTAHDVAVLTLGQRASRLEYSLRLANAIPKSMTYKAFEFTEDRQAQLGPKQATYKLGEAEGNNDGVLKLETESTLDRGRYAAQAATPELLAPLVCSGNSGGLFYNDQNEAVAIASQAVDAIKFLRFPLSQNNDWNCSDKVLARSLVGNGRELLEQLWSATESTDDIEVLNFTYSPFND